MAQKSVVLLTKLGLVKKALMITAEQAESMVADGTAVLLRHRLYEKVEAPEKPKELPQTYTTRMMTAEFPEKPQTKTKTKSSHKVEK